MRVSVAIRYESSVKKFGCFVRRKSASSTQGSPQWAMITRRSRNSRPMSSSIAGRPELQLRVDPRGAGLVDHHRDAELLGLRVDREGDLGVVDRPVLVHRIELDAGEPELDHGALELLDGGVHAAVRGVHRGEADETVGVCGHDAGDRVVASIGVLRPVEAQEVRRIHGADQAPFQDLRRDREHDHLVEPGVIAERLLRADHRPSLACVAARPPTRAPWACGATAGAPSTGRCTASPSRPYSSVNSGSSARLRMWLCASMIKLTSGCGRVRSNPIRGPRRSPGRVRRLRTAWRPRVRGRGGSACARDHRRSP